MTTASSRFLATIWVSLLAAFLLFGQGELTLEGDCYVHDPSTIVKCNGKYWLYGTGPGCISRYSTDLTTWYDGPSVFARLPAWVHDLVPGNTGWAWAPDIKFLNGNYYLYYSVSTFGKNASVIGLATNPTLEPTAPNYHWTDQGVVVQSTLRDNFNAIDPCIVQDTAGKLWLTFGSFWSGIKMVQLNAKTGKRISPQSPLYALAQRPSPDAIEASYIVPHGGYYYLFVNWDFCCRGVNSTYNIRVGRSKAITGPYLDKDGVDMRNGSGTLFLGTEGNKIGPGCIGVLHENGVDRFSYHYYDKNANGRPTLDIRPLVWGKDGWPTP